MARFFGIAEGETREHPGLRIHVLADGEKAWMHGKWLDLGPDHAVAYVEGEIELERPDGRRLRPGQFPCWRVDNLRRPGNFAIMFSVGQFLGGKVRMKAPRARTWSETPV